MLSTYHRSRILVLLAAAACFSLFWGAATMAGFPHYPGFAASVLQGSGGVALLVIAAAILAAATVLGALIAGRVRFDAGLLAAAAGLSAWSMRGGGVRYVLFSAGGPSVYGMLLLELLLLGAAAWGAFALLRWLQTRGWLRESPRGLLNPPRRDEWVTILLPAMGLQTGLIILCMLLLAHTDAKAQALVSVTLSAYVGTGWAVAIFSPDPRRGWYLAGPVIAGTIGFVAAMFLPDGWRIGQTAVPLARALPLDWISAGVAGSILGWWSGAKLFDPLADVFLFGDLGRKLRKRRAERNPALGAAG